MQRTTIIISQNKKKGKRKFCSSVYLVFFWSGFSNHIYFFLEKGNKRKIHRAITHNTYKSNKNKEFRCCTCELSQILTSICLFVFPFVFIR